MAPPKPPVRQGTNQPAPPIDPALVERMFELQAQELATRREEMALRQRELDNGHEYSKLAIDAEERDRRHAREERRKGNRERYVAYLIIGLAFLGIVGFTVYANHSELAQELIKDAGIFLGGGGAGFATAKARAKEDRTTDPPSND